ncbi:MAG: recombinase family protein [Bacillota bacterium]
MEENIKVAGYVRQSDTQKSTKKKRGGENISPLQQREAFENLSKAYHWDLRYVEEDLDFSGFKVHYSKRPGLMKLLELAKSGSFNKLIVYRYTRLARRTIEFLELVDLFESYGVGIISYQDKLDTSTPEGRLMRTIQAGFAQYQSEDLSEYISHARRIMVEQGRFPGGKLPYGYFRHTNGSVIPDPELTKTVKKIFELYVYGEEEQYPLGTFQIANHLSGQGIPSPNGKPWWQAFTVRLILSNPAYIGKLKHLGEVKPGLHEAIIDEHSWNIAQQKIAEEHRGRRKQRNNDPALLQGAIPCPICGAKYKHKTNSKNKRPGYEYRYSCSTKEKGKSFCDSPLIDSHTLETAVTNYIFDLSRKPELLSRLEAKLLKVHSPSNDPGIARQKAIQKQINSYLEALDKISEAYFVNKEIKREDYSRFYEQYSSKLVELRSELATLELKLNAKSDIAKNMSVLKTALQNIDMAWELLTPKERHQAILALKLVLIPSAKGIRVKIAGLLEDFIPGQFIHNVLYFGPQVHDLQYKHVNQNRYTPVQRKFIADNYGIMTAGEIAKELDRTEGSIRVILEKLKQEGMINFSKEIRWSEEQDNYLVSNYNKISQAAIANHLGKSRSAVQKRFKALKEKGLIGY